MPDVRPHAVRCVSMAAIAAIAWFALGLQLYLEVLRALRGVASFTTLLVHYFSFFTILTNILVALTLTVALLWRKSAWGRYFSRATVQTGVAIYIVVVGAIYSLLLRQAWDPVGAQKLVDVLLHDVVPIAYVLYWLIFVPKVALRWKHAVLWLGYPVAYTAYTLAHGAMTGWYPYPFVDAAAIGLPRALGNGVLVLLLFFALGLLAVAIGRWTARRVGSGSV